MDFFRRLLGIEQKPPNPNATETAARAPEIAPPGSAVDTAPPVPVVQGAAAGAPSPAQNQGTTEQLSGDALLFGATRQLPQQEIYVPKPGQHMTYGLNSDVGMVRNNNQDSLQVMFSSSVSADGLPDFGLFVVADGMGGHHDGERASAIATRVIARYVIENFYMKVMDSDPDKPMISEVLSEAFQKANEAVAEQIPEGGTTATAAVIVGDLSYIAHVGDSRAYLITNDGIEQVTRDHSLVQRLIELDQLRPEEAAVHPQRNVLYKALGQSDHVEIDAATRRLPPGSRLLLCSDGLWNNVSEEKLLATVRATRNPQEACDRLVAFANDRGGTDNITIVLIQIPG